MEEKPRPANLAGMFIGGQVPFELAGLIFKAFYSAGINPKSFELAPIYTDANVAAAVEEMGRKLSNGTPLQIADGTKKRRLAPPIKGGSMRAYLLSLINEKPRSRAELKTIMTGQTQWSAKSLDARVHDLLKIKMIHRDADDYFHPTKKGAAILQPKAEPVKAVVRKTRSGTQLDFVLSTLEKAWPEAVPLSNLRKIFKAKGLRPESASVALNVLKATGRVTRPEPAKYKFIKPRETQSDVHSSKP